MKKNNLFLAIKRKHLAESILLLLFISIQVYHINTDFWNDEIYTLKNFVFVPLKTTITDYHVPNNHILFNLINNLYLKIIGVNTLHDLMEHPFKLRVLPFLYSIGTFIFLYKTAHKYFDRKTGLLVLVILSTTVTFYYFSLQIRGYSLSMFLASALIYYALGVWNFSIKKNKYIVVILTCLLFYTVPSNILFILGFFVFFGTLSVVEIFTTSSYKFSKIVSLPSVSIQLLLFIGLIFGFALYLPIIKPVFFNEYVSTREVCDYSLMKFYFTSIWKGLLSNRYFLLPVLFLGIPFLFKTFRSSYQIVIFFMALCLTPPILIYLRNLAPPPRVFIVLLPTLILLFSIFCTSFIKFVFKTPKHAIMALVIVFIYSFSTFLTEIKNCKSVLKNNLSINHRSQNLYYQYYSESYQPLLDLQNFDTLYQKQKLPIISFGCEDYGIPNYLDKFSMDYALTSSYDSLSSLKDSFYIITNHPAKVKAKKGYIVDRLNPNLTYHNVLLYRKDHTVLNNSIRLIDSLSFIYGNDLSIIASIDDLNDKKHLSKYKNIHFHTDDHVLGELIKVSETSDNLFYLNLSHKLSSLLPSFLVNSSINLKNEYEETYFLQKDSKKSSFYKTIHTNDFEKKSSRHPYHSFERKSHYEGVYSELMDENNQYSTSFVSDIKNIKNKFVVSFWTDLPSNKTALAVLEINNKVKKVWQAYQLQHFANANKSWHKIVIPYNIPKHVLPTDQIKFYVWNNNNNTFRIDDIKIETER